MHTNRRYFQTDNWAWHSIWK